MSRFVFLVVTFAVLDASACFEPECTAIGVVSVTASVTDADGTSIDDATVSAVHEGTDERPCPPSGDDGRYVCEYVGTAGDFVVTADKDGFVSTSKSVTVEDGACHPTPEHVELVLSAAPVGCCCAFIRPGDFDIISEEPAATEEECLARDQGSCLDPAGRLTPHPCCPTATGDRCE